MIVWDILSKQTDSREAESSRDFSWIMQIFLPCIHITKFLFGFLEVAVKTKERESSSGSLTVTETSSKWPVEISVNLFQTFHAVKRRPVLSTCLSLCSHSALTHISKKEKSQGAASSVTRQSLWDMLLKEVQGNQVTHVLECKGCLTTKPQFRISSRGPKTGKPLKEPFGFLALPAHFL